MLEQIEFCPKEKFLKEWKERAEVAKRLISFINNDFEKFLSKFDNKVINKRFYDAFEKELIDKIPYLERVYPKVEDYSSEYGIHLTCNYCNENTNYQWKAFCTFVFPIKDKRLLLEDTMGHTKKYTMEYAYQDIENYIDLAENYDEYMKLVKEMQIKIEEFRHLPHAFKANIKTLCTY